jgi:hypothetical protein
MTYMNTNRHRVFIGSSLEGLKYANAIFSELEREAYPTVWDQDVFAPTVATLEQLETLLNNYDFAILVLTPDDMRVRRGHSEMVPRDNVVAELGLFIGSLGRSRVFFITPQQHDLVLPTDFLGITPLHYIVRDDNQRASVRTACNVIKSQMQTSRPIRTSDGSALDVRFWHSIKDRQEHRVDVRALIASAQQVIIITGITLSYVVQRCGEELRDRLRAGLWIGILMSAQTEHNLSYYTRYTSMLQSRMPLTRTMYESFYEALSDEDKSRFALYETTTPLTHSIGLYDTAIYVSEFCLDCDSSTCPSFSPARGSTTYRIMVREVQTLLSDNRCVLGQADKPLHAHLSTIM